MPPHEGLTHPKEYDIKDSNVEFIGSSIDHLVKYNSSTTEPAWNNGVIGKSPGLYIWRIEDFQVIPWPASKTGSFYSGDSYIILHSYKLGHERNDTSKDVLGHDVFFWLGSKTSQDEAGTAAYKTVELDEFLGGKAVQHREVQLYPSGEFISLFPQGVTILSGGVKSGFRHVTTNEPETSPTLLLRVFKLPGSAGRAGSILVHEVEPTWKSLDDDDVFVLEKEGKIWVWQGKNASALEKGRAAALVGEIVDAKHVDVEVLAQTEPRSRVIVSMLGGDDSTISSSFKAPRPIAKDETSNSNSRPRKLFRISDASGTLSFGLVKEGEGIQKGDLDTKDVFLLDTGSAIWVWRGAGASKNEREMWMKVVESYVRHVGEEGIHSLPVKSVVEGSESPAFWKALEG